MAKSNVGSQKVAVRCGYYHEGTLLNARILPNVNIDDTLIYAKTN